MPKPTFAPNHYPYVVLQIGGEPRVMYMPAQRIMHGRRNQDIGIHLAYDIAVWMNARVQEGKDFAEVEECYQELLDAAALELF